MAAYPFDLNQLFDDAQSGNKIEYRDPLLDPWGSTKDATPTQLKAWALFKDNIGKEFFHKGERHVLTPFIGLIGAKGSSKTHLGACIAGHMAQKYPGSVGCLISNSYQQAKDNGGPILMKVIRQLGYEIEFFTGKKVGGRQFTNFYEIRLGNGISSFVLVRSFDAIGLIEGSELDWGWAEEVQDVDKDAFVIFISRIRGKGSPNVIFVAAMPEPGTHWQYKLLPKLGFIEEEKFDGPVVTEIAEGLVSVKLGCMWEPSVFENKQNLPPGYIQNLLEAYSPEDAQRYVYGKRGATRGDRVFYQYRDDVHRTGAMSRILCEYEPTTKLIISYDFNVYPMSAAMFQPKLWNDKWLELTHFDEDIWIHDVTGKKYISPEHYCVPDRKVFAQVDEMEVWPDNPNGGMTRGMVMEIEKKYLDHMTQIVVLGDASGNQRRSSSTTTDWQIIGASMKKYREPIVHRGLIANSDFRSGVVKYSNPAQRDALQNANRMLMDATGKVQVCFLPESTLQSGGVASAITALGFKPDGTFDIRAERKMDRDVQRSHFADVYKYFAWYGLPPHVFNERAQQIDRETIREERRDVAANFEKRTGMVF